MILGKACLWVPILNQISPAKFLANPGAIFPRAPKAAIVANGVCISSCLLHAPSEVFELQQWRNSWEPMFGIPQDSSSFQPDALEILNMLFVLLCGLESHGIPKVPKVGSPRKPFFEYAGQYKKSFVECPGPIRGPQRSPKDTTKVTKTW